MRKIVVMILNMLFVFFMSGLVSAATINDQQFPVKMDRLTLKESLDDLGRIYGVDVVLVSNLAKLPQGKVSLNLEQVTLEKAIKEVMRKTNVQNHAMFMDRERNTLLVWILSEATGESIGNKFIANEFSEIGAEPLSQDQVRLLAQLNQGLGELNDQPLTSKQIEGLQKQSDELAVETEEGIKPLTPEQIDQLKEQSILIEAEMEQAQRPLSSEQIELLQEESFEIEIENEIENQPLSKEQINLLKEQEDITN